jgi:hypothetical protein
MRTKVAGERPDAKRHVSVDFNQPHQSGPFMEGLPGVTPTKALAGVITEDGVLNLDRHFRNLARTYDAHTGGL